MTLEHRQVVFAGEVLPDGNGRFTLCPPLLTEAEAIRFLRLDGQKAKPENTLQHYRERGILKATIIGKNLFYTRKSLCDFLDKITAQ
jgi:hypothetical protein